MKISLSLFIGALSLRIPANWYKNRYRSAEYNTEEQQEPSNSHAAEVSEGFRSLTLEPVSGKTPLLSSIFLLAN